MALRTLSLCAGIGGIDLGLARWSRTVCFLERDAFAAAVLVARMEEEALDRAPIWDDLRTFDGKRWRGAVDLVVAGYPCQPFSVAGKQLGERDERHLWPEVARIIAQCGAPLAFLENVPGHLRLGFDRVLADLAALGFDAEWDLVRASDVGAPHRRERLFVLAYRDDEGRSLLRSCGVLDGERTAFGNDADGLGAQLAHADCESIGPKQEHEQIGRCWVIAGTSGADVADGARRTPTGSGHELNAGSEPLAGCGGFPPGPADRDGWRRWIEAGGPQPVLRRGVDGLSAFVDRADRLRALGNAVVPAQAARAFLGLARRALT